MKPDLYFVVKLKDIDVLISLLKKSFPYIISAYLFENTYNNFIKVIPLI